ncbi:MAG: hypothetical protein HFE73_04490 [Firmicutes bacterium]|nr:hypothetical protein [Bacillota bacterium]
MGTKLKMVWWKVPLYCVAAGWLCFKLKVHFLGRFALVTLPDGTITPDNTKWLIMDAVLFCAVIIVGGLLFFRRMYRKEVFLSSSVMVGLNVVLGLIAYQTQGMFAVYWSEFSEWDSFVVQALYQLNVNEWVSAVVVWALPYLFVLFGRKDGKQ